MRANRAYNLIVSRGGVEPAFLAGRDRRDRIEIVSIDDGEVVLYWQLPARQAAKMVRELRADLVRLGAEEFIATWSGSDGDY